MSHTKRVYNDPSYNGSHKWFFDWIHEIKKPWKQLSNKTVVFHKDLGIPKKLLSKRRRQQNKKEIENEYISSMMEITEQEI